MRGLRAAYTALMSAEPVKDCAKADRGRGSDVWISALMGLFFITGGVLLARHAPAFLPAAVVITALGIAVALSCVAARAIHRQARHPQGQWRLADGGVALYASWPHLLGERLPPLVVAAGSATAIGIMLLGHPQHSQTESLFVSEAMVILGLVVAGSSWAMAPACGPQRPALVLSPQGVWLWPGGSHEEQIPWTQRPRVLGVGAYCATVLTDVEERSIVFPMGALPLGYCRFRDLIMLYTDNPEMWAELATDAGLRRVRGVTSLPHHDD